MPFRQPPSLFSVLQLGEKRPRVNPGLQPQFRKGASDVNNAFSISHPFSLSSLWAQGKWTPKCPILASTVGLEFPKFSESIPKLSKLGRSVRHGGSAGEY
jgi:hypothetical protein